MCLIVDANVASAVFAQPVDPEYEPIFDWLEGDGKIVTGGKNLDELYRVGKAKRFLVMLRRRGRLHEEPRSKIEAEQKRIKSMCRSDDPHVIALARLSKARTLCTEDKRGIMDDFRNRELVPAPKGKIYRGAKHRRLLVHTKGCPGR